MFKPIFGKVNEGDKIKKTFDKLKRATKKHKQKKHGCKNVFLSPEMNLFFSDFFFIPQNCLFFFGNRQKFNARAGQKKNTCFFLVMRGLNLMRALI